MDRECQSSAQSAAEHFNDIIKNNIVYNAVIILSSSLLFFVFFCGGRDDKYIADLHSYKYGERVIKNSVNTDKKSMIQLIFINRK